MKRHLNLNEQIEAKEYFEVLIYRHAWYLQFGKGEVSYEVVAKDMNDAISKALQMHHEILSFTEDAEEDEPSYVTKLQVIRLPDEEILENIWDGHLGSLLYMRHWCPDMETKELIRRLEENEPDWFPHRAYQVKKIWELDLTPRALDLNISSNEG